MGRQINYAIAQRILEEEFNGAGEDFRRGTPVAVPRVISESTERMFVSSTQAFREALVGCALARIIDDQIDLHLPYMKQGENAFNGRTLDERVVNPFLQDRSIPCSRGPYLSAFRRNISFVPETVRGLRDRNAYLSFLRFLDMLQESDQDKARLYLRYLLYNFVQFRETANIQLVRIQRLSVEQYQILISASWQCQVEGYCQY